jgi:hypothetical protein
LNNSILGITEPKSTGVSFISNISFIFNFFDLTSINSIHKNSARSLAYLESSAFSVVKNFNFTSSGLYLRSNAVIIEESKPHETNTPTVSQLNSGLPILLLTLSSK